LVQGAKNQPVPNLCLLAQPVPTDTALLFTRFFWQICFRGVLGSFLKTKPERSKILNGFDIDVWFQKKKPL